MLEMILKDPIVWGSLLGLAIVVGLCGYYVYLFLHNVAEHR
ncbi:hypothetical protein [Neptunicella marina]|nr:hypothetical protein [Neptunicella marina]